MKNPPFSVIRRRFLAGAGTVLALPMLESLLPRHARAAATVAAKRLILVHTACGVQMPLWTPAQTGSNFTLSPTLSPLSKVQKNLLVLSNMRHDAAEMSMAARSNGLSPSAVGKHGLGLASLFSGAKINLSSANKYPGKAQGLPTMDQIYAKTQAGKTGLASLHLALPMVPDDRGDSDDYVYADVMRRISWDSNESIVADNEDPVAVFNNYFAGSSNSEASAALDAQRTMRKSVLDNVLEQATDLQAKLSRNDAQKLEQYFTSVRALEQQLGSLSNFTCASGTAPAQSDSTAYQDRAIAMMDLMALALQCDLTRAITFNFGVGHSRNEYNKFLDVSGGVHYLSHSGGVKWMDENKAKIEQWEMRMLARFWQKIQDIDEGGASILDNSASLVATEIADSNNHDYVNTGYLVVGGAGGNITTGRHVRAGSGTTNGNLTELQLALLQALDTPVTSFGGFNTTKAMTLKV